MYLRIKMLKECIDDDVFRPHLVDGVVGLCVDPAAHRLAVVEVLQEADGPWVVADADEQQVHAVAGGVDRGQAGAEQALDLALLAGVGLAVGDDEEQHAVGGVQVVVEGARQRLQQVGGLVGGRVRVQHVEELLPVVRGVRAHLVPEHVQRNHPVLVVPQHRVRNIPAQL